MSIMSQLRQTMSDFVIKNIFVFKTYFMYSTVKIQNSGVLKTFDTNCQKQINNNHIY